MGRRRVGGNWGQLRDSVPDPGRHVLQRRSPIPRSEPKRHCPGDRVCGQALATSHKSRERGSTGWGRQRDGGQPVSIDVTAERWVGWTVGGGVCDLEAEDRAPVELRWERALNHRASMCLVGG